MSKGTTTFYLFCAENKLPSITLMIIKWKEICGDYVKCLKENESETLPRTLVAVRCGAETEFASENGLADTSLYLEHLRTAFRFAVELENESRVGFGSDIQVKLCGGAAFSATLPYVDPTVVENDGPGLSPGQI